MNEPARPQPDPAVLTAVLREVARKTIGAEHWLSVDRLDLDYPPEDLDAALRTLIERGWLSRSEMTLHSVSITAAGSQQLARPKN